MHLCALPSVRSFVHSCISCCSCSLGDFFTRVHRSYDSRSRSSAGKKEYFGFGEFGRSIFRIISYCFISKFFWIKFNNCCSAVTDVVPYLLKFRNNVYEVSFSNLNPTFTTIRWQFTSSWGFFLEGVWKWRINGGYSKGKMRLYLLIFPLCIIQFLTLQSFILIHWI